MGDWLMGRTGESVANMPTDTNAYTSGDVVGGGGLVQAVMVIDADGNNTSLDLVVLNKTFSSAADSAAISPSLGDGETHSDAGLSNG